MAMFATLLKRDRERNGLTQAQVARQLGISLADYRAVEDEEQPATGDLYEKAVELFGWPAAYVAPGGKIAYR
jgi:transcriptional regulator with XRE-family HTH domain